MLEGFPVKIVWLENECASCLLIVSHTSKIFSKEPVHGVEYHREVTRITHRN
jgi:hypothetical protein